MPSQKFYLCRQNLTFSTGIFKTHQLIPAVCPCIEQTFETFTLLLVRNILMFFHKYVTILKFVVSLNLISQWECGEIMEIGLRT